MCGKKTASLIVGECMCVEGREGGRGQRKRERACGREREQERRAGSGGIRTEMESAGERQREE